MLSARAIRATMGSEFLMLLTCTIPLKPLGVRPTSSPKHTPLRLIVRIVRIRESTRDEAPAPV
jgi:hypothetical protein